MFNSDNFQPISVGTTLGTTYRKAAADLYKDLCPMLSRQLLENIRIRQVDKISDFYNERSYCKFCSSIRTKDNHKIRIRPKTLATKKLLALAACQVKSSWKISRKQDELIQRCFNRQLEMVYCCNICKKSVRQKIIPRCTGPQNTGGIKAGRKVKPIKRKTDKRIHSKLDTNSERQVKGSKGTKLQRISDVLKRKERIVERKQEFHKNNSQFSEKLRKRKVAPQITVPDGNVKMPASQVSSIVEDKSKSESNIECRKKKLRRFFERANENEDLPIEKKGRQIGKFVQHPTKLEMSMDLAAETNLQNDAQPQLSMQSPDEGSSKNNVGQNAEKPTADHGTTGTYMNHPKSTSVKPGLCAVLDGNADKPIASTGNISTLKENNKMHATDPEYRKKSLLRFFQRLPKEANLPTEETRPQLKEFVKATETPETSIDTLAHNIEPAEPLSTKAAISQLKMDENSKRAAKRRIASILKGKDPKKTNNPKLKKKNILKLSRKKSEPAKGVGSQLRAFLSSVL